MVQAFMDATLLHDLKSKDSTGRFRFLFPTVEAVDKRG